MIIIIKKLLINNYLKMMNQKLNHYVDKTYLILKK